MEGHHIGRTKRDCGTHWRGNMFEKRKGPWYPQEGHYGGEQKGTVVPTGETLRWRAEKDRDTHRRGIMLVKRNGPWYP
jgi:hypothetical protein